MYTPPISVQSFIEIGPEIPSQYIQTYIHNTRPLRSTLTSVFHIIEPFPDSLHCPVILAFFCSIYFFSKLSPGFIMFIPNVTTLTSTIEVFISIFKPRPDHHHFFLGILRLLIFLFDILPFRINIKPSLYHIICIGKLLL